MNNNESLNKNEYILADDYVKDIRQMQKNGPWKVPLGLGDRFQLLLLEVFLKITWFKDIYIKYPHDFSPAYNIIFSFLKRKKIVSHLFKIDSVSFIDIKIYGLRLFSENILLLKSTGYHDTYNVALSKAMGEMIERSVTGMNDENNDIIFGSFNEFKLKYKNILYPPKYHRFLPQQREKFNELNFDDNQKMIWVKGFNFLTNEVALIPRSITSWKQKESKVIVSTTTNGSAGAFLLEDAIKRAILEYIERDSFLVHWLTKVPPNIIRNDSLPDDLCELLNKFTTANISVYVLDTTTNIGIPSICVVMKSDNKIKKSIAVSGGAGIGYYDAIKKALNEAVMCSNTLFAEREKRDIKNYVPFINDVNLDKRVGMWQGDEWIDVFDWFISGNIIKYSDCKDTHVAEKEELSFLKNIFRDLGDEYVPLIYIPQNKILDKVGFHVVQSFVPFCFPLYIVEKYGTFDSDRLIQFAKYKGLKDFKLNPYPHPFP